MTKEEIDEIVERVTEGIVVGVNDAPLPTPPDTQDEKAEREADRNANWAARAIHAKAAMTSEAYSARWLAEADEKMDLTRREVAALERIANLLECLVEQGASR